MALSTPDDENAAGVVTVVERQGLIGVLRAEPREFIALCCTSDAESVTIEAKIFEA